MNKGKITVVGIGPGNRDDITPAALSAIRQSDVIIGYNYYFQFIQDIIHPDTQCIDTGMKREKIRAEEAYKYASEGKTVTVISSGDAGIYGMAPLIYEMRTMKEAPQVEIEVVPGISAFQKAASLLGAPIGHDLCIISLSDLMTPWLDRKTHTGRRYRRLRDSHLQSEKRRALLAVASSQGAVPRRTCTRNTGRLCPSGRTRRAGRQPDHAGRVRP